MRLGASERSIWLITFDASAAIELVLSSTAADRIAEDLRREAPVIMPAHFEADAYSGLRRMTFQGLIERDRLPGAIVRVANMPGERVPLAPLLPFAYDLFDRVGAHDAFYVVLAQLRGGLLLTSDAPLANAASSLGIKVLLRRRDGADPGPVP